LLNCLRQPRLFCNEPPKSMRLNFKPAFQVFCRPDCFRASETESVGLAADAHGVMVFAIPSRLFHHAPRLTILTRTWYRQDYFIVHPDFSAICQDLQKPRHRDTDGNSPNRRAVIANEQQTKQLFRNMRYPLIKLITYLAQYLFHKEIRIIDNPTTKISL